MRQRMDYDRARIHLGEWQMPTEPSIRIPAGTGAALPSGDRFAADLRGFGPVGILALIVILLAGNVTVANVVVPLDGILVLVWVRWSQTPWREIGYVRPKSWIGGLAAGLAFGCVFKYLMKAIVMPLLGAPAINPAYHYLAQNRAMLPTAVISMVAAGVGEETVFRGYLFERLFKLFGTGAGARASIVLLSTAVFSAGHYFNLGLPGVEQAIFTGLVFGTIFAFTGRIWMLMCAHAGFDLTALAIIYWNLESEVAHLVVK
jgi:membrane protease YdiL (CAAX protease family)